MQKLFGGDQPSESAAPKQESSNSRRVTMVLGFLGSAIICWVSLRLLAPVIASSWGIMWITPPWTRVAIALVIAAPIAGVLSRIEGTIWGKYYVIVGYLSSLALIVCIALRLLHYL